MPKSKIYFRADGNSQIGLGHIIRSLALADMLKSHFECHFITRTPILPIKKQVLAVCQSIIELPATDKDSEEAYQIVSTLLDGSEIVVLDGYHFVTAYQKIFKDKGCRLVCIDDIHAYHFLADVVINHAGGISKSNYSITSHTQIYLGLKYALLRKEFLQAAQQNTIRIPNKNVFICFGGADPKNDTLLAIRKCESADFFQKSYVVIGAAYQYIEKLKSYCATSKIEVEILSNLSAQQMVNYMSKCIYAITPPSSVSFEYLSVGGILFLKVIADNQKRMYQFLIREGIAFSYDDLSPIPNEKITLTKQNQYFDGLQKKRLQNIFKNI